MIQVRSPGFKEKTFGPSNRAFKQKTFGQQLMSGKMTTATKRYDQLFKYFKGNPTLGEKRSIVDGWSGPDFDCPPAQESAVLL